MGSHRLEPLLFQRAQNLGLGTQAHIAHFIEEKCAAVGLLELADLALMSGGEAAFHVAKQLAFNQIVGDGGAIHFDKRPFRPQAQPMQRVGYQFLSRTAFPENQHPPIGWSHEEKLLPKGLHRYAFAHNVRPGSGSFAQLIVLQTQTSVVEGVFDHQKYAVDGKRLFQKVESSEASRFNRGLNGAVAGDHDDYGAVRRGNVVDAGQGLQSIHAG